jgi:hypothetical protein
VGLTLVLLAWWQWAARPLPALGVVLPEGTGAWLTLLVCTGGIGFYAQQARTVAASPEAQASLEKQLESQSNVRMLRPATVREARVFTGVSLTAGICEEVLYRGYLLWYLQSSSRRPRPPRRSWRAQIQRKAGEVTQRLIGCPIRDDHGDGALPSATRRSTFWTRLDALLKRQWRQAKPGRNRDRHRGAGRAPVTVTSRSAVERVSALCVRLLTNPIRQV